MSEGSPHAQDDTESHTGSEDCGHAGDDGLDRVGIACGGHDEPEEHVDHVDDPDGAVQVQTVTKHQFPWAERLGSE